MLMMRVIWAIIAGVGALVSIVGGLVLPPGALLGWAALGLAVGVFAWLSANDRTKARRMRRPAETGIVVGAETFVGCLLAVGAAAILGDFAWLLAGLALVTALLVVRLRPRLHYPTSVRLSGSVHR